jgi:glycerol-3-phosphate O-acyltransferase 3/4
MAGMESTNAEMDLDRPNLEEYLPPDSIPGRDSPKNLHL